jgi:hypothetical protein
MGKARIRSNKAKICVEDLAGNVVDIGEVDTFNAKSLDELVTSQPVGENNITSHAVFKGWELSFAGGTVDWNLATLIHLQDTQIGNGGRSPYFKVEQTIEFYNGRKQQFSYEDVTIHGYELDVPNQDALNEKFMGFSGKPRSKGAATNPANDTQSDAVKGILGNILNAMAESPANRM